ncbi:MAG: glycosyltransferase family 1 protein [Parvularculaceae bacterium]
MTYMSSMPQRSTIDRLPGRAPAPALAPLRVAVFAGNYNYVMDGPLRALNKLVGHLLQRGHEVLVFAPTSTKRSLPHQGELVSISSLPLPGARREYRLGLGLQGEALRRLSAFKPTLIHIAAPDLTGFMALKYAEKREIPVVASFHTRFDTYPRYYGARWFEKHVTSYMRNFYGRCEHVYAPSQSMADELKADGIGADIRLWARGADATIFNPGRRDMGWRRDLGFDDDDVVVLFVGRVVREKGLDEFADAVRIAAERNSKLKALAVGDGPELGRFKAMLPKGVFTGYLEGEALARAYASADIFFNPSITETFGNVTLEAMACGLPSVCAAASGSLSLVEDGVTGLLSPPDAGAAGYANKLKTLAESGSLRRQYGAAAHAKSRRFEWAAILDHLIGDYREAVAAYRGTI